MRAGFAAWPTGIPASVARRRRRRAHQLRVSRIPAKKIAADRVVGGDDDYSDRLAKLNYMSNVAERMNCRGSTMR